MSSGGRLPGWLAAAVFVALIAVASIAGSSLVTDPAQFREDVASWGTAGLALALALALVHAVVPYPAELLGLATGFAYGFIPALILMIVLWTVSALVAFWIGQRFGPPLVGRLVKREALERAETKVAGASAGMLLTLRVIPIVPYNLVSYPSGMFGVPLVRFTWTTTVGLTPQLAFVTYAGSQAVEPSLTDLRLWAAGVGWLALILVGQRLAQHFGNPHASVR